MKKLILSSIGMWAGLSIFSAGAFADKPEEVTVGYLNLVNAQLVTKSLGLPLDILLLLHLCLFHPAAAAPPMNLPIDTNYSTADRAHINTTGACASQCCQTPTLSR